MDIFAVQKWTYLEAVPDDTDAIKELLKNYSGIPEAEINSHLLDIVSESDPKLRCMGSLTLPPTAGESLGHFPSSIYRAMEIPPSITS